MLGPVANARDEQGRDVTGVIAARDARYLSTFAKGPYQGIADEHFVEFELGEHASSDRLVLAASGWIYPTDSSINVAIGQGGVVKPSGLLLEAMNGDGRWVVVDPDLGFPAGKNKTMLIDLGAVSQAKRLRLRTNLEIYWDSLTLVREVDVALRTRRLAASRCRVALPWILGDDVAQRREPGDACLRPEGQCHATVARSRRLSHQVR